MEDLPRERSVRRERGRIGSDQAVLGEIGPPQLLLGVGPEDYHREKQIVGVRGQDIDRRLVRICPEPRADLDEGQPDELRPRGGTGQHDTIEADAGDDVAMSAQLPAGRRLGEPGADLRGASFEQRRRGDVLEMGEAEEPRVHVEMDRIAAAPRRQ